MARLRRRQRWRQSSWAKMMLSLPLEVAAAASRSDSHYLQKRKRKHWWSAESFPRVCARSLRFKCFQCPPTILRRSPRSIESTDLCGAVLSLLGIPGCHATDGTLPPTHLPALVTNPCSRRASDPPMTPQISGDTVDRTVTVMPHR